MLASVCHTKCKHFAHTNSMEQHIFFEISLVFVIVAAVAGLMRYLRQPLVLGYILTGILVGPIGLNLISSKDAFEGFSEIGIVLLLFIIGLGMNVAVIKSLGKVSLLTAAAILVPVGGLGWIVSHLLGFDNTTSMVIGLALFFSSTIIILKALSDKKQVNQLYGQIAIGVIIVDDIIATLAMVLITAMSQGGSLSPQEITWMALKALLIGFLLFVAGAKIIPHFARKFAKNQELLFIFALAWGFGIANLFHLAGFSAEVGALFAGVSLAGVPYAAEMSARLKPLRDFFVILFFVYLGQRFIFGNFWDVLIPAVILSVVVLIGKPLAIMSTLGALRYTKLTSFKAGIHLSQISEFSIILVVLAASKGMIDTEATSVVTLIALLTIGISSYLMQYDEKLYRMFEKRLSIFERKKTSELKKKPAHFTSILFGFKHGGYEFVGLFRETKEKYIVVDYNPDVIDHMDTRGIRHAYGDATDYEFLEELGAARANFAVSVIGDIRVNQHILTFLKRHNPDIIFTCHARSYEDALTLYRQGAAYVILPSFLGSEHLTAQIKKYGMDKQSFDRFRQKHIVNLGHQAVKRTD